MIHLKHCIRGVFFSLMALPLIIFLYFIANWWRYAECTSSYATHERLTTIKRIAWPEHGLLTLWFDGDFFAKHAETIIPWMHQRHLPGVISFANGHRCQRSPMSRMQRMQRMQLWLEGWEIAETHHHHLSANHQNAINDMPTPLEQQMVRYDVLRHYDDTALKRLFDQTKAQNGWIILYFHDNPLHANSMNPDQLNRVLHMAYNAKIPVVLHEQALRVSQ